MSVETRLKRSAVASSTTGASMLVSSQTLRQQLLGVNFTNGIKTAPPLFSEEMLKKLFTNKKLMAACGGTITLIGLISIYLSYRQQKKDKKASLEGVHKKGKKGMKNFYKNLKRLIRIVIPSLSSKEFWILVLHTAFLVSRTFLSIWVAKLDGSIVKSVVDRNGKQFLLRVALWLGIAIPATYVNSMIKFLESKLSIALRTRLTEYCYELYMKNETYYRVGNLDSRLNNPDQCLTEDINNFCSHLAHVHSQLSKPILDVILNTWQLISMARMQQTQGAVPVTLLISGSVIFLTARMLKWARPKFGQMVARQAELEGELRFNHSRLITNAEEIAFYGGHQIEKSLLYQSYLNLAKHLNFYYRSKIFYVMLEGFLMKYVWSTSGLLIVAIPAFLFEKNELEQPNSSSDAAAPSSLSDVISKRTQNYVTAKNLLLSCAEAVERIMLAYKAIAQLAGYTQRVTDMLDVFLDVQHGHYVKQKVLSSSTVFRRRKQTTNTSTSKTATSISENKEQIDSLITSEPDNSEIDDTVKDSETEYEEVSIDLNDPKGEIQDGDGIIFDKVPIVSPNGDVLVKSLNFKVDPGQHLLITGPNGCGKSSLFRILGDLWPVYGGRVVKPPASKMFYVPQRPYLCNGTLRDQVIYPDTREDMIRKGVKDEELEKILDHVDLAYVLKREGWDKIAEWKDVLSGGEKQRVGMARLFYHKPSFAILDECTSAVSIDVEGKIYQTAIDDGITLITVSHRPSLWKYHNLILQFNGEGGYSFSPLNAETRLSLKDEKLKLEAQLSTIQKSQNRLRELCKLLGEDSVVLKKDDEKEESQQVEDI